MRRLCARKFAMNSCRHEHPRAISLTIFSPPPGGETINDYDVAVLRQRVREIRAKPAPPVTM
jgi:hypothetical protein